MKKESKIEILCEKFFNILNIKNKNRRKLYLQIIKFIIVGGIATIIDYIVFFLLHDYLKINTLISNIISFTVSVIYNYIASITWVFEVNTNLDKKKQFIVYIILSIIGLVINTGIVYLCVDILKMFSLIGKVIATVIVMTYNFITRKMFLEKAT